MDYPATVTELRERFPELADEVQAFDGVVQVVDWLGAAKPEIDFISHDEFSYDFLIHKGTGRWLVFGVN
jgi:hypothetical protein